MTGQIGTAPAARRRGGRALALLAAGLLSLAAPLAAPSAAIAHDYLIGSTPEEGSTVSDVPEVISVTSGEPLLDVSGEAGGFALQVRDSSGGYYGDGCLTINGSTLTTPASFGEAGDYTVGWRLVSPDGHTVDGEFAFRWEPAADFEPAPAAPNPPGCGEVEDGGSAGAPADSVGDPQSEAAAVSRTELLWVLGTVVVVGVALFGTLLLLARRRKT